MEHSGAHRGFFRGEGSAPPSSHPHRRALIYSECSKTQKHVTKSIIYRHKMYNQQQPPCAGLWGGVGAETAARATDGGSDGVTV